MCFCELPMYVHVCAYNTRKCDSASDFSCQHKCQWGPGLHPKRAAIWQPTLIDYFFKSESKHTLSTRMPCRNFLPDSSSCLLQSHLLLSAAQGACDPPLAYLNSVCIIPPGTPQCQAETNSKWKVKQDEHYSLAFTALHGRQGPLIVTSPVWGTGKTSNKHKRPFWKACTSDLLDSQKRPPWIRTSDSLHNPKWNNHHMTHLWPLHLEDHFREQSMGVNVNRVLHSLLQESHLADIIVSQGRPNLLPKGHWRPSLSTVLNTPSFSGKGLQTVEEAKNSPRRLHSSAQRHCPSHVQVWEESHFRLMLRCVLKIDGGAGRPI